MILCELGQVRKEATAADDSCAGVWLLGLPPNILSTYLISEYYTLPSTILVLLDSMSAVMSVFSVHR